MTEDMSPEMQVTNGGKRSDRTFLKEQANMKKQILFPVVTAAFLLFAFIFWRVQASDKPDTLPEFETTSEVIMNYRDASGENYTIKKVTYINRSPTRSGYHSLNINSDKNGCIYGKRGFCDVESVFYLGNINDESYIYSVIYPSGQEFLALKGGYGLRSLEYTDEKNLDIDRLAKCYNEQCFDDLFVYLTQNAEDIKDKYLSEQADTENINEFIGKVSLLQGRTPTVQQ